MSLMREMNEEVELNKFHTCIALLFFLAEVTVKLSVSLAAVISVAEFVSTVVLDISATWFNLNVTLKLLSLSLAQVKFAMLQILFFKQEIC